MTTRSDMQTLLQMISRSCGAAFVKCFMIRKEDGQAVVEFTLIFILFLVIAWIPADFGLALYSGQIAQNASRESARIAAADPTLTTAGDACTMPSCSGNILSQAAGRLSSALLPGATIAWTLDAESLPPTCDRMVTVSISGNYNYFFYRLLGLMGFSVDDQTTITRTTSMRWEHQC
jgi:Flp pilus assembly protein TadG